MNDTFQFAAIQLKFALFSLVCVALSGPSLLAQQVGRPEVIGHYWSNARKVWAANESSFATRQVTCRVTGIYQELARGGIVKSADTSVSKFYLSGGKVDSIVHLSGDRRLPLDIDISFPAPFDSGYVMTLYPNDAGAGELAVGFDTDTTADIRPSGMLILDRDSYVVRRVHMAWPQKKGFRRFGRSYHFVERGTLLVPDSIVETAVIKHLLADDDYRLIVTMSEYEFGPMENQAP